MGGLGCFPLISHLHARDLKWISRLFIDGELKLWVQLVLNIMNIVKDRSDHMSVQEIAVLPTPLRVFLPHLNWELFTDFTPFVCEIEWLRPSWLQLQRDYYLRYCTDVDVAIAYVQCITLPPRVVPQWQLGRKVHYLENY